MTHGPRVRALLAILVVLGLAATGCTGRYPARLLSKSADTVEIIAPLEPMPSPSGASVALPSVSPSPEARGVERRAVAPRVVARTKSGTTVTQAPGGLPKADIWPDSEDRVGITADRIDLCMHAAFSLGPLFDTKPDDGLVYWQALNDSGGIYGRKVNMKFLDDLYTAAGTEQALDQCRQSNNPFFYLGGVGFDQAPAGRAWAERNKLPYLHNVAVEASNMRHSFSFLPSIETNGGVLGQFVASRFPGKKVGAIYVDTDNWRAGFHRFEEELAKKGMGVAPGHAYKIPNNNYPDFGVFIDAMQRDGIQVVDAYINAVALARFLLQADEQGFHPVVVSPDGFDLVTDTVGNGRSGDGTDHLKDFAGIYAAWVAPAYEIGPPSAKDNPSVPWHSEMKAMKAAYAKHLPAKTPNDVDWAFWLYSKTIHKMLLDCSKDCSRNIMAGLMLTGYKTDILGCPIDFSLGNGRLGGHYHNVWQTRSENDGRSYWRQIETCKRGF